MPEVLQRPLRDFRDRSCCPWWHSCWSRSSPRRPAQATDRPNRTVRDRESPAAYLHGTSRGCRRVSGLRDYRRRLGALSQDPFRSRVNARRGAPPPAKLVRMANDPIRSTECSGPSYRTRVFPRHPERLPPPPGSGKGGGAAPAPATRSTARMKGDLRFVRIRWRGLRGGQSAPAGVRIKKELAPCRPSTSTAATTGRNEGPRNDSRAKTMLTSKKNPVRSSVRKCHPDPRAARLRLPRVTKHVRRRNACSAMKLSVHRGRARLPRLFTLRPERP